MIKKTIFVLFTIFLCSCSHTDNAPISRSENSSDISSETDENETGMTFAKTDDNVISSENSDLEFTFYSEPDDFSAEGNTVDDHKYTVIVHNLSGKTYEINCIGISVIGTNTQTLKEGGGVYTLAPDETAEYSNSFWFGENSSDENITVVFDFPEIIDKTNMIKFHTEKQEFVCKSISQTD